MSSKIPPFGTKESFQLTKHKLGYRQTLTPTLGSCFNNKIDKNSQLDTVTVSFRSHYQGNYQSLVMYTKHNSLRQGTVQVYLCLCISLLLDSLHVYLQSWNKKDHVTVSGNTWWTMIKINFSSCLNILTFSCIGIGIAEIIWTVSW